MAPPGATGGPPAVYDCSGLRIASDIDLSAPLDPDQDPGTADVRFVLGDPTDPPFERPSDDVVAELAVDGFLWYTFCRVDGGFVGRMPGIGDFVIDAGLRRVVCHPATVGRSQVLPIVLPGTVTAFLLASAGSFVLHGSAVELDGRALAFVGPSGQGKSTMAALFCAAGATLVADDVLPLTIGAGADGGSVTCVRSGREIRLRAKAESLVERFGPTASVRTTEDERRAVSPQVSHAARLPLAAIVLPRPDRDAPDVRARRLTDGEASLVLARCERIEGWRDRAHLRRQFASVGQVVAAVPVFEAWVPWGPPFLEDLPRRLLDTCGIDGRLPAAVRVADGSG